MIAAATYQPMNVSRFAFLSVIVAVVILAGAALHLRGPDLTHLPIMASSPIIMPDGTPLYVQKFEVTVAEWNRCADARACALHLRARPGQTADTTPATGISHADATQYLHWINAQTRYIFRLPTLAEWSHMAASVLPAKPDPIFTDPSLTWASAYLLEPQTARTLKPQGSFDTTVEGIADLNGSVWEWTQDCYAGTGSSTPARCPAYFVGGAHIAAVSFLVRDPARGGCAVGVPPAHLGLRLVSDAQIRNFAGEEPAY